MKVRLEIKQREKCLVLNQQASIGQEHRQMALRWRMVSVVTGICRLLLGIDFRYMGRGMRQHRLHTGRQETHFAFTPAEEGCEVEEGHIIAAFGLVDTGIGSGGDFHRIAGATVGFCFSNGFVAACFFATQMQRQGKQAH